MPATATAKSLSWAQELLITSEGDIYFGFIYLLSSLIFIVPARGIKDVNFNLSHIARIRELLLSHIHTGGILGTACYFGLSVII